MFVPDPIYPSKSKFFVQKKSDLPVFSAFILVSVVFFCVSLWGSSLFWPYAYYSHPLINTLLFVLFTIISLICSSQRIAYLALVIYVGLAYGIADSLLIDHNATSRWVSWGIFQIHDASDFLDRAAQFLITGTFETHRGRVLNILTYAALLDLSDFDTVAVTQVLTYLGAITTAFTTLIVSKKWGVLGGAVFTYIILEFANGHIGGFSSEMPGLIFGLLAFCLLLSSSEKWSGPIFIFGFLILCISLLIRVGAVFILAATIFWIWHVLRQKTSQKWLIILMSFSIIAGLLVWDSKLTNTVAPTSGGSFANAYDSWYAIHVEGQLLLNQRDETSVMPQARWVQIYRDNPGLRDLRGTEEVAAKRNVLIETFFQSPLTFFVGSAQRIGLYFSKFIFAFVEIGLVKGLLALLTFFGIWRCWKEVLSRGKDETDYLLAFGIVAIVLSIPFLYGAESRAIGSTVGFIAGLPAAALSTFKKKHAEDTGKNACSSLRTLMSISSIVLLMIFIPIYGYLNAGTWFTKNDICGADEQRVHMNTEATLLVGPGSKKSFEQLERYRDQLLEMRADNIALRKTSFKIYDYQFNDLIARVKHLKEPALVGYGVDVESGELVPYLFADPNNAISAIGCLSTSNELMWFVPPLNGYETTLDKDGSN